MLSRLDDLESKIAGLSAQLTRVTASPGRSAVPEVDPALIDAAVARHLAAGGGAGGLADAAARGPSSGSFAADDVFADLRQGDRSWEALQEIWSGMSSEEQDAVLAQYEALAKANPLDANTQNELGEAYVHRLMNADMAGMMEFGPKAERQFDRALELDDHHWSARFNKAMSLSNQPAFLGRRPEAIQHFTTLMEQQEGAAPESRHQQTYLFLGNLYAQSDKGDEARDVWQRGLERFPDSGMLRQRLEQ